MAYQSIDNFLSEIETCTTFEALFSAYRREMEAEGYQNIVFGRIGVSPDQTEVPYGVVPDGVAKQYFQEHLWMADPILAASQSASSPFTWDDEIQRGGLSAAAKRVMEEADRAGVKGGLTMPFHGPGGRRDLFSLSMRDERSINAERIPIVNLKTYATLQRYMALEEKVSQRIRAAANDDPGRPDEFGKRECALHLTCDHIQHGEGIGVIADAECRAIALAYIGWRRYSAGLLELNRRIPDILGRSDLERFMDRGLIEEDADDDRFAFFFKPTPVGLSHVRLCSRAPLMRHAVLRDHVRLDELPRE